MKIIFIIFQHFLPSFQQVIHFGSIKSLIFTCDEFTKLFSDFSPTFLNFLVLSNYYLFQAMQHDISKSYLTCIKDRKEIKQ